MLIYGKKIFLSYPGPVGKTNYTHFFPQNCMYLIIKYIDSIFKCYHNSDKYQYKKLFNVGQREVILFLFTLVTNKREHSIFSLSKQTLTRQKRVRKRVKHCERCKIVKASSDASWICPQVCQILLSCTSPGVRPYMTSTPVIYTGDLMFVYTGFQFYSRLFQ